MRSVTTNSRRPVKQAIALQYKPGRDRAPRVVAKGRGRTAETIVEIAHSHDVPVVSDPSMLAALRLLPLDREIPPQMYHLVAELLTFVYSLEDRPRRETLSG